MACGRAWQAWTLAVGITASLAIAVVAGLPAAQATAGYTATTLSPRMSTSVLSRGLQRKVPEVFGPAAAIPRFPGASHPPQGLHKAIGQGAGRTTVAFAAAAACSALWAVRRERTPRDRFAFDGEIRSRRPVALLAAPAAASAPSEFSPVWEWMGAKGLLRAEGALGIARDAQGPLLRLQRDVAQGEVLLEVPTAEWLTADRARREFNAPAGEPEWLTIASALLAARRNTAPALQPWATTLPPADAPPPAPVVLLWPPEDQDALLAGTQLLTSLQGYRSYVEGEAQRLGLPVADLLWAFAVVRSRRRPPLAEGAELALIPGLDLVRHAPNPHAVANVTRAGMFGGNRPVRVVAARPAKAGEVVTCDFDPAGPIGEGTLLLDYGQACVAFPQHTYTLQLAVPPDTPFRDDKLDVLELAGVGPAPSFTLVAGTEPPAALLAVLRLLALQGPDAFLLEAIFRREVWGFCQEPISQANERSVCDTVVSSAQAELAQLPPSGTFVWTKLDSREAVAAYAAASEARALRWAADWFGQRVKDLRRLEYYQERRLKGLNLLDEDGQSTYNSGDQPPDF